MRRQLPAEEMIDPENEAYAYLRQLAETEPVVLLEKTSTPATGRDVNKRKRLEEIAGTALHCKLCSLSTGRKNVVFGTGNPSARLMFVGEGPGADEDRQGEPFVGRAGQLLNRIIAAMDMKREDVYIANIVKCRPPNNREPSPAEAETCIPYLKQQIDIIEPEVIVLLGKTAAIYMTGLPSTTPVKELRGRLIEWNNKPLVVTYHPAAALRNPDYKPDIWRDMQMVLKLLSGEIQWSPESPKGLI